MSRARSGERGLTLLEVMVSVGVLALIATLIYGAFDGMSRSRQGLSRISDRYHQGRTAVTRISRELQSAFLSMHQPLQVLHSVRTTAFVGSNGSPADRLDFTSFSHRRLGRDAHESDQNELGYFAARDPEADYPKYDLVRREQKFIDTEPTRGGIVQVVAEDIERLDLEYLDATTGEWTETWDSTQPASQLGRLPLQVKITLVLKGGPGDQPVVFQTKAPLAMQSPLSFAMPK